MANMMTGPGRAYSSRQAWCWSSAESFCPYPQVGGRARGEHGNGVSFGNLKARPRDMTPSPRPQCPILLSQMILLGTRYSNICTSGAVSIHTTAVCTSRAREMDTDGSLGLAGQPIQPNGQAPGSEIAYLEKLYGE